MPNEILSKYGTATQITFTMAGLADGSAFYSDAVTDTTPTQNVRISCKVTTGSTPTANTPIEFYLSRADDDSGTEFRSGGTGTTTATYTGTKAEIDFVHAISVASTANKTYYPEFIIEDPGTDWNIVIYNETGDALNSTAANHEVRYRTVTDEVQ